MINQMMFPKKNNIMNMNINKFFYFLLLVFFISCDKNKNNQDEKILDPLVFKSYEYIAQSTAHLDSLSPYRQDIVKLKHLADNAISKSNSQSNNAAFEEFAEHVMIIMQEYNGNKNPPISSFTSVIENSLYTKIRFLEHISINSIIRDFHLYYFTFDIHSVIVVPDKPIVGVGETYNAKIYLAANDSNSPIKLIVENDTIPSCDSLGTPVFSTKPKSKGTFSHEAGLIVNDRGEKLTIPFRINYEVK